MKKIKCSILGVLLSGMLCASCKAGDTLPDITKPYLGEYEFNKVIFNEKDYLSAFDYVRFTLNDDNTFLLSYKEKGKERKDEKGEYEYDKEKEEIILSSAYTGSYQRRVPIKDGVITLSIAFGNQTFFAQFKQK